MCLVLAGVAYYYLGGYAKQIKELQAEAEHYVRTSTVDTFKTSQTGIVYDANGNQISVLKGEKDVYYLPYDEIPTNVTAAIVSIEDKKFYKHGGVDYKAIMRAVFAMLKNGEVTQGGSTITQQLARNVFISQERTWQRKMEEIFIALRLEKKYTKNEILEFYLNNINFANGYYGIQAASKGYFNVTVDQLDLSRLCLEQCVQALNRVAEHKAALRTASLVHLARNGNSPWLHATSSQSITSTIIASFRAIHKGDLRRNSTCAI